MTLVEAATDGPWASLYTPVLGYWNRLDATAKSLTGRLLRTGDLGHLDDAGFLFVHDRSTDLIRRGGGNVYPAEVERIIIRFEA